MSALLAFCEENLLVTGGFPTQRAMSWCHHEYRAALDSFTVFLHSPNNRHLPAIRAAEGTISGLWKRAEIAIGHVSPQFIAA